VNRETWLKWQGGKTKSPIPGRLNRRAIKVNEVVQEFREEKRLEERRRPGAAAHVTSRESVAKEKKKTPPKKKRHGVVCRKETRKEIADLR